VLRARATPRTTVHAAWWSGPRPSGFRPEIVSAIAGRRRWTLRSTEDARGRRSIRGTSMDRRLGKTTPWRDRSAHRSERCGVNPQALVSRGNMAMRRAPRREAIVFENRIRELQTSVERTGVAAGPHPRAPGSPSKHAGRRRGRNTFGGGDLARRDLRTSDVVEKRAPVGSRGNAIHCQVERGPRTRSGPKRSRRDGSEAGSERKPSCKRRAAHSQRASEIDTIEDVGAATTRAFFLHRRRAEPQRSTMR